MSMAKLFDLTGKVALVTGGNGGLGLAMAKGLAQAGAGIVVAARDEKKTAQALSEIRALNQSQGGNYIFRRWQRHCRCKHQCIGSSL